MDGENNGSNPMNKWDDLGGLTPYFWKKTPFFDPGIFWDGIPRSDWLPDESTCFSKFGMYRESTDEFVDNRDGSIDGISCPWLSLVGNGEGPTKIRSFGSFMGVLLDVATLVGVLVGNGKPPNCFSGRKPFGFEIL